VVQLVTKPKTLRVSEKPSILRNLICPLATRLKSRTSAASSVGSEPCVFTRRRNSSWSRSMVFVVRNVFRCAFGKRKNVSSSSPPSRRLVTTPGQRLANVRSKAVYAVGAASALSVGRVDDAVEVVTDLGESMLRRFAHEIAQLVDAAALDGTLGASAVVIPRPRHSPSSASVTLTYELPRTPCIEHRRLGPIGRGSSDT
jgi:hypothetical protein